MWSGAKKTSALCSLSCTMPIHVNRLLRYTMAYTAVRSCHFQAMIRGHTEETQNIPRFCRVVPVDCLLRFYSERAAVPAYNYLAPFK